MNVAKWSVTRPVAVTMRIAALVLLGIICFFRLPVDLLPKVELGTIAVNTSWPNTSPEEMETQITRPIEQAVSTLPGLYSVNSSSEQGSSSVRITLNYGVDPNKAALDVLQYVERARRSFPNDPTIQNPTITKFDPNAFPVLILGVSGIDDPVKLRTLLRNEVSPILESAGGVAQVNISGGIDRAIIVDVDPRKLQLYGFTLAEISRRIQSENTSAPAGIAQVGLKEFSIRAFGYFDSLEDAERTPIGSKDGKQILLRDVAKVTDANQEIRVYSRLNGDPAVGVTIVKQGDANTIDTVKAVKEKIKQIEQRYPELTFGEAYNQARFVEDSVHMLQEHALIGGSLAVIAILIFLRNIRSTIVVALSIPISICSTFALMYFFGYTLNTISLSALALATGLIVDDAIVVLENIFRHIERDGRTPTEAAVSGTKEIMTAVLASTFTVMVVFMPLFLIQGQSGQIFTQLALVVVFSLAASLLDATTVVPMMASKFIKADEVMALEHPEAIQGKRSFLAKGFDRLGVAFHNLDNAYRRGLQKALKRRGRVLIGAALITVAVLPLWPMVGNESLPKTDTGDLNVRVRLPIGTSLSVTTQKMAEVEKILLADPDVETVFLSAGANVGFRGGVGGQSSFEGGANVRLKKNRKAKSDDVVKRLTAKMGQIPGIRANVSPFDLVANIIGGQNQGMQVDFFGQDMQMLGMVARQAMERLQGIPGLENVDVSIQDASPELRWKIDRQKAETLGLTFQDIAGAIGNSTRGALSGYYQEKGYQYPIYVQLPVSERRSVEALRRLPVKLASDGKTSITLGQVATPVFENGPNQINRLNRQRFISVNGRIVDRAESEVQADVRAALDGFQMPGGVHWEFGERQRRKAEEFAGLGLAVGLALALIYMLLASQFESFTDPLIVLFTVPLCVVGVILALFLTDRAFGLTAFVGLLMLIGIVVKNGILLVDYTKLRRAMGESRDEAILNAAPTRLRPILMTSVSAVLGMMPIAVATGGASELQAPLATVVIGGLITSTVMTLFVVPVVYSYFDDWTRKGADGKDIAQPVLVEPSLAAAGPVRGHDVE